MNDETLGLDSYFWSGYDESVTKAPVLLLVRYR